MKRDFLDLNKLTKKDWEEIKAIGTAYNLNLSQALYKFMQENPGKIEHLGELRDGEVVRDEITIEGVKEYKGQDALRRMIEQIQKNKNE